MNNYPYNPYGNQGQQYSPYQQQQPGMGTIALLVIVLPNNRCSARY